RSSVEAMLEPASPPSRWAMLVVTGLAMAWGGSAAWIVLAGYQTAALVAAVAGGVLVVGFCAPAVLLIAGLAWANNPATQFLADFSSGIVSVAVDIDGQLVHQNIDNSTAMLLQLFLIAAWLGPPHLRPASVFSLAPLTAGLCLSFTRSLWLGGAVAVGTALVL